MWVSAQQQAGAFLLSGTSDALHFQVVAAEEKRLLHEFQQMLRNDECKLSLGKSPIILSSDHVAKEET